MDDLWPKDLTSDVPKIRTPVSILKEQGSLLGDKTGNIIKGVIRKTRFAGDPDSTMNYSFELKSPPLNYSYDLFIISHEITLYPLDLHIGDADLREELGFGPKQSYAEARDEEEFKSLLKRVFNAKKVKAVIATILAQSEEGKS